MKRIVLAAAGAAVVGLTACSHTAAPASATAGHGASSVPVSCGQQYHTWAKGVGTGLLTTFDAVSVAEVAGDSQALTVALKKAKPAVTEAARYPVPACADPKGYWNVLMMHVNAAAGGKGSASSVRAALKGVPAIQRELTVELKSVPQ